MDLYRELLTLPIVNSRQQKLQVFFEMNSFRLEIFYTKVLFSFYMCINRQLLGIFLTPKKEI